MVEQGNMSPMMTRISEKAKQLHKVIDPQDAADCWQEAWTGYLEDLIQLGPEDQNRIPSHEFLHKKCVI